MGYHDDVVLIDRCGSDHTNNPPVSTHLYKNGDVEDLFKIVREEDGAQFKVRAENSVAKLKHLPTHPHIRLWNSPDP